MKFTSEYSTRRQVVLMLLTVLDDLRSASKQRTIDYIRDHHYFDVQPEDWPPYPKSQTREPRWHTLIAWARKTSLENKLLIDCGRDQLAISRDGVQELSRAQELYRSGRLTAEQCYMWTPKFKRVMQPVYVSSHRDTKRPATIYQDSMDHLFEQFEL